MGDRLLINGEEVIFKGWVDQSLTAIEVKVIADEQSPVKQVRARDIKSLSRSRGIDSTPPPATATTAPAESHNNSSQAPHQAAVNDASASAAIPQEHQEKHQEPVTPEDLSQPDVGETTSPEEQTEITKEPEYNAWEVWMYLERQRLKTLKLLNTFQAEWEANRFVREAERSAPPTLRVHYEIRPVWLDESTLNSSNQHSSDQPSDQQGQNPAPDSDLHHDPAEIYADAIDVEIIS